MNFRFSIKQVLARIRVAEKKKDLKVTVVFKKELIPFLTSLRQEGLIFKFVVVQKTFVLCLKKKKIIKLKQAQRVVRDFHVSAALFKNPTALFFVSTTFGVLTKSLSKTKKIGGTQLFLTY
jgi:ribosomal protein S8